MRPRHKAAENGPDGQDGTWYTAEASMRPRHKAAENKPAWERLLDKTGLLQ